MLAGGRAAGGPVLPLCRPPGRRRPLGRSRSAVHWYKGGGLGGSAVCLGQSRNNL